MTQSTAASTAAASHCAGAEEKCTISLPSTATPHSQHYLPLYTIYTIYTSVCSQLSAVATVIHSLACMPPSSSTVGVSPPSSPRPTRTPRMRRPS